MTFLRIAVFEMDDAPPDAFEVWDDLVGSALRNNPDCVTVMASRTGARFAAVSTWTSEQAMRSSMAAQPFLDLVETVAARLGMAAAPEPAFLYEGEVS